MFGAGEGGEGGDLIGGVDGAGFGDIGDRQDPALNPVNAVVAGAGQGLRKCFGRHLAVIAGDRDNLGAVREKLGRAAFIDGDMGIGVGEDRRPRLGMQGEGERIGGGAGGDKVNGGLGGIEQAAKLGGDRGHDLIGAIAAGISGVGGQEGGHDLGGGTRGVVRGENHVESSIR